MGDDTDWKAKAERYESQLRNMGVAPIDQRGLSNWKNLFRKPTLNDIITLILILLAITMGWAYNHDITVCREYIAGYHPTIIQPVIPQPDNVTHNITQEYWINFSDKGGKNG
jgi:hypothetical protein